MSRETSEAVGDVFDMIMVEMNVPTEVREEIRGYGLPPEAQAMPRGPLSKSDKALRNHILEAYGPTIREIVERARP